MTKRILGLGLVFSIIATSACTESTTGQQAVPIDVSTSFFVDTELSHTKVKAGSTVFVTCHVTDRAGQPTGQPTTVRLDPPDAASLDDHTLTAAKAGTVQVACAITGTTMEDPTPAILEIQPDVAVRTVATVEPTLVVSGETAMASCRVEDSFGNPATSPGAVTFHSSDEAVASVKGAMLDSAKAGTTQVTCEAAGIEPSARIPASLTVQAGEPTQLIFLADPDKAYYMPGDVVALEATAADPAGNPVGGMTAQIKAPNQGVSKVSDNTWKLNTEGTHLFTATLSGAGMEASKSLVVDGTPPNLVILSPARGSTLSGTPTIQVKGNVSDNLSGVTDVDVSGYTIQVHNDGDFGLPMPAAHGMNRIEAMAIDGAGHVAEDAVAAYHSQGWQPYGTESVEDARLDNALQVFLSQEILDDGDHSQAPIDDLATMLEVVLADLDLSELSDMGPFWMETMPNVVDETLVVAGIPITLQGDAVFTAGVSSVLAPNPKVNLDARQGGVVMDFDFLPAAGEPGLEVLVSVRADLPINVHAEIDLGGIFLTYDDVLNPYVEWIIVLTMDEFAFTTDTDISKTSGQPLLVNVVDVTVDANGFDIDPFGSVVIDLGELDLPLVGQVLLGTMFLDDLIAPLNQLLGQDFLAPIVNGLLDVTTDYIAPLMKDQVAPLFIGLIESMASDRQLTIPAMAPTAADVVLDVDTELDTVWFTEKGGQITMSALTTGPETLEGANPGSILRAACNGTDPGSFAFAKTHPMETGIHVDLVNQLLHGAWRAGAFDITWKEADLSSGGLGAYGISQAALSTSLLLPPIVEDCNGKGTLFAQVGDMLVTGSFTHQGQGVSVTAYVSAAGELDPTPAGKAMNLSLTQMGKVTVTITELSAPASYDAAEFEALITDELAPALFYGLSANVMSELPVPMFDISAALGDLMAPEVEVELGDLQVIHQKGVLGFAGGLK